ncbi:MAG: peptidase U62 [Bacteroidetes bacterium 4572_77]|nr:MAG: peptidase U62 [Bacteroidetes bacterium 4572_77]
MAEKYDEYKELNLYNDKLSEYSKANKISILKEIENEIYKLDNRIKSINYNMYFESEGTLKIKNTNGVDVSAKNNLYGIYFAALSSENGQNKSGSKLLLDRNFENIDIKSFAKEVVEKSVSLLNSKPVKSGNYKVVFENTCFADLLASFSGIFSAESVQKDLSLLKGKLGEKIAADIVNIVDNPFLEGGFGNQSFDAEGVPTMITNLIKDGELKNYLYNLKTAKKDGVKSTGNASKGSYKSSVGIAASNLYLEKGNKNFDQILEEMGNGVLITDLAGLHSGLNPISGDFSLAASGFLVENGKKIHALDQFTVAGNFITLLQNVLCIANDSKFAFPQGDTFIASPSVLINELSISGE